MLTNTADEGLADALLDEGVSIKERCVVLVLGQVSVGDFRDVLIVIVNTSDL